MPVGVYSHPAVHLKRMHDHEITQNPEKLQVRVAWLFVVPHIIFVSFFCIDL
jgi:hypothetical protein